MTLGERQAHRGVLMRVWAWVSGGCVCGHRCVGMGEWAWVCEHGCVDQGVWARVCGHGCEGMDVSMGALEVGVTERVRGMVLRW